MNVSSPTRLATLVSLAGLTLTLGTGCAARTVAFTVTRPSMINVSSSGNTMTVGPIEANGHPAAAAEIAADLAGRIGHSLNPSVRLLANGGGLFITGKVIKDGYEVHGETVSQTCSRSVDDGPDANGVSQSHSEDYDCSSTQDVGKATSWVELRILDGLANHRLLFSQTYVRDESLPSPSAGDSERLLHKVRAASVEAFARLILPWQETVSERFKDCDGDARCKQAFERVHAGDLPGAEALYTQVIAGLDTSGAPVPPGQGERIGEALYDRGVTRAYLGRYPDAVADLERAIAVLPQRSKWPLELARVQAMAKDQQALRVQGVPATMLGGLAPVVRPLP
jgi:hypothetical protein